MDLNVYQVILRPVITDKAYKSNQKHKQLVFFIHPKANKTMVAAALQTIFNVVASSIRTVVCKGKRYRLKGNVVRTGILKKKAIVTLAEGYSLDIFGHEGFGSDARAAEPVDRAGERERSSVNE